MKINGTDGLFEPQEDDGVNEYETDDDDGWNADSSDEEDSDSDSDIGDTDSENESESDSDANMESEEEEISDMDEGEAEAENDNGEIPPSEEHGDNEGMISKKAEITSRTEVCDGKKVTTVRIGSTADNKEQDFLIYHIKKENQDQFISFVRGLDEEVGNQIKGGGGSPAKKSKVTTEINEMFWQNSGISDIAVQLGRRPAGGAGRGPGGGAGRGPGGAGGGAGRGPGGAGGGLGGDDGDSRPNPTPVDPAFTFDKCGGLETQISYLRDNVILNMVDPQALKEFNGGMPPKGIILYGVPGSGKTMLAQALANELSRELGRNVAFYYRKGPDCFSKYFGETNARLEALFREAARNKPSIIFFDEIDGLCPSRERLHNNGGEAYTTVVTTLLGLMDVVVAGDVLVMAATNRLESVDPAMLRPGRFDKKLVFHPPHELARKKILEINLDKWEASERPSEDLISKIAKETTGFTGADLQKLCRDAFLKAFDRHIPNFDINSNTEHLKVLPEDWMAAIKGMSRTSSLTFGSFLYVPSSVQQEFLPLLAKSTSEILKNLQSVSPLRTLKHGHENDENLGYNSYLITDRSGSKGGVYDNLVVSNLLADKSLGKCPVYIISEDTLTGNSNYLEAVDQAADAPLSILLILRLDYLINSYPSEMSRVVPRLQQQLRGKQCLVLATATCAVGELGISALQSIFVGPDRSHTILSPTAEERRQFFRPIFQEQVFRADNATAQAKDNAKKTYATKISGLEAFCIAQTANSTLTELLELYAKLSLSCSQSSNTVNKDDLIKSLDEILVSHI